MLGLLYALLFSYSFEVEVQVRRAFLYRKTILNTIFGFRTEVSGPSAGNEGALVSKDHHDGHSWTKKA